MKIDTSKKYQAITATGDIAELDMKTLLSFSEKTLLYFYPKDDTPGCTAENKDFTCLKSSFDEL
jgi:peroxiredoxin